MYYSCSIRFTGVNNGDPVKEFGAGSFFGERALLVNEARNATITVDRDVGVPARLLRLSAAAYHRMLRRSAQMQE
eukprot:SAG11_NODE_22987_length_397_cov_0.624161_1_plen_74_part_10